MGYFLAGIGLGVLVTSIVGILAVSLSVVAGRTADAEAHLQLIGDSHREAFRPPKKECLDEGCPCFWEARAIV